MDQSQFQREQSFLICLSYLERLRENGLMTDDEFAKARKILVAKFDPPLASLLTEKP